jgi:formylglycine-generating enzyme required for sulfatase activity
VNVTWTEAQDFCAWLTRLDQNRGTLTEYQRYRLPTDAEWSTAVGLGPEQGASPAEKGKNAENAGDLVFPWGKEWPPKRNAGNYGGEESVTPNAPKFIAGYRDDYPFTSPVGAFPANRFKLCDLSGNVWEWCLDWMDASEKTRVLRGGSFNNVSPRRLTSAFRNDDQPDVRYPQVGFRCVIEFSPH